MPPIDTQGTCLVFRGCNFLKQRLILSVLSGKPVKIIEIRSENESQPGLREFEICLIRLLDKLTNGTKIEVSSTGTTVLFSPGLLHGGQIQHDCSVQRSIGYYLDVLIALGPFCKFPLNVTLKGITNGKGSPSVDNMKSAALTVLNRFLVVNEGLELKIIKRGVPPLGGGEVLFRCPICKILRSVHIVEQGMVKRIRGTVYTCKVSPVMANRTVEAAKGIMLKFLPDVYVYTDQNRFKISGHSPGFGICLHAETTDGVVFAAECNSHNEGNTKLSIIPEDIGKDAALRLLDEIYRGGGVDSSYQWLITLFMTLSPKNVSKFITGPLSSYTVNFLQHLRDFFSITFKLENPDMENFDDSPAGAPKVLLTCVGIGYTNINKKVI